MKIEKTSGSLEWLKTDELTTLQKTILVDSIMGGKDFKETLKQIGIRKTNYTYGVIDNSDYSSPVLVKITGSQYSNHDKPRYLSKIVAIETAVDEKYILGHSGFSMSGFGYPWQDSVQIKEFESDTEAYEYGKKLVAEFHVKEK